MLMRRVLVSLVVATFASHAFGQSFVVRYSAAKSPEFADFNAKLKRERILEALAEGASKGVSLPMPVTLTITECGSPNAFYEPRQKIIAICFELIKQLATEKEQQQKKPTRVSGDIFGGALVYIFLHEVGHALIDQFNLPVLGREEDAADQISTYLLLKTPNQTEGWFSGAMWFFRKKKIFYTRVQFSDEHSLSPQRQSNIACWAFGANPTRYSGAISDGYLSVDRAKRCQAEYQKLDNTVRALLGPNLMLENK